MITAVTGTMAPDALRMRDGRARPISRKIKKFARFAPVSDGVERARVAFPLAIFAQT
ncbi:hypothetical protein [Calditerricola satsumensis]|uniref:Uncharacterized protein n=1 Tax=Calditerricola satsumensis TaxID=373054 RepID=A0A8J3BCL0_9BACI|nr:hypothetical protein [Calditerricola satsumensis]GGJ98035.1 hypothetical protein GCM10007043_09970 [Calditerricola satsumensis]